MVHDVLAFAAVTQRVLLEQVVAHVQHDGRAQWAREVKLALVYRLQYVIVARSTHSLPATVTTAAAVAGGIIRCT